jgi:hypothetical protein
MGIVGVLLIIVGVVLFFIARNAGSRLAAMNAANTFDNRTLKLVHRKIVDALDPTAFVQPAEVEGTVSCEQPLYGPVSGRPLAAFRHVRMRVYEESVEESTGANQTRQVIKRQESTVADSDQRVPFSVNDASGATMVLPEGAEIDLSETANRFEEINEPWRGKTRTLGYRDIESGLELGSKVYVLATAVDRNEEPVMAKHPSKPDALFLISRRSERELAEEAAKQNRNLMIAAPISAGLGVLLIIIDLLTA